MDEREQSVARLAVAGPELELDIVDYSLCTELIDNRWPSCRIDDAKCDGRLAQDRFARAIHQLRERGIRIEHHPVVQSRDDQRQGIGVECLAEPFLRFHQRPLRKPAAGDVSGDAERRLDRAGRVPQGDCVRREPTPLASETDHFELERARFAGEYAAMQFCEGRTVLRSHDVGDG